MALSTKNRLDYGHEYENVVVKSDNNSEKILLKDIATIFTEQISLDTLTESGTVSVALVLSPASLRLEKKDTIKINYLISKKPS